MQSTWNKGSAEDEATPGVFYGSAELQSGEYSTGFAQDDIFPTEHIEVLKQVATADSEFQVKLPSFLTRYDGHMTSFLVNHRFSDQSSISPNTKKLWTFTVLNIFCSTFLLISKPYKSLVYD